MGRALPEQVEEAFAPDGALAAALPDYAPRESQIGLARAIAEAIEGREVLLAEAGTGTGKTLGYLIPAVLSGRRVVVSTATRALQSQLVEKDVPLVAEALDRPVSYAVLKGRRNYFCWYRRGRMDIEGVSDLEILAQLSTLDAWAERSREGDRAEVETVPEDAPIWDLLTVDSDRCLGTRCADHGRCFAFAAKRRADAAQLIIVNHHLYFGDLAARAAGGRVLPDHDVTLFDEAHAVPDIATRFFGITVSSGRLDRWCRDAMRSDGAGRASARLAIGTVRAAAERLFRMARPDDGPSQWIPGRHPAQVDQRYRALDAALEGALGLLQIQAAEGPSVARLVQRAATLRLDLQAFFEPGEQVDQIFYREARGRGAALSRRPVEAAGRLQEVLYQPGRSVIFTSATLSVGGKFGYVAARLGAETARCVQFESPFDFERQARLYLPEQMPQPQAPEFPEAVAAQVRQLTGLTEGRAFVLFTSYRNLEATRALLHDLPFPMLRQGEAPRRALLARFRDTPGAVLFATASFWEGVDVVGDGLSLVIIDKLPFENPSDPQLQARMEAISREGGSAFAKLQVPAAALALKQGFGRLIRSTADRGVVAILDPRLTSRGYGKTMLRALPPAPIVKDFRDLERWWRADSTSD